MSEFQDEANTLLSSAKECLVKMSAGEDFKVNHDIVFRAFRSILGGAGFNGKVELRKHMLLLEDALFQFHSTSENYTEIIEFLIQGTEVAVQLLNGQISSPYNWTELNHLMNLEKPDEVQSQYLGKIAVVDDEEDVVEILSDILTNGGFEVVKFTSPLELLSYLKLNSVDMVFSDFRMPQMDGLALANAIGLNFPDLPIVLVSGHLNGSVVLKDVYAIILKPFDFDFVLQTALFGVKRYQMTMLLNKTIDLMMYHFSDLDDYLKLSGKVDVQKTLNQDLREIVKLRGKTRELNNRGKGLGNGRY